MTLREQWEAGTRGSQEIHDICLDALRIMASNSLKVNEILPSLIDEENSLHFLYIAHFLDHVLLELAYCCYGCAFDSELARHLVAAIESGQWPTCAVGSSAVLALTEALNPKDDV